MITITNFESGEVRIHADQGGDLKLDREVANRLIMAGRMHTVAEFIEKIPHLIPDAGLSSAILAAFEKSSTSSEKWNVKEKFARLRTLAKGFEPKNPESVVETITIS